MTELYEKDSIDFIPINNYEKEEILNRLSDDILISNIQGQIDKKILDDLVKNDLLVIFNNRYNFIVNYYKDYSEIVDNCKNIKMNIYGDIIKTIGDKFSFNTNIEEISDNEDYFYFIEGIYNFYILNYYDNLIKLSVNYIMENKKELIKEFEKDSNKKDLIFKSLRKSFKDNDNIHLIYNLDMIIDSMLNHINDDPYEIIRLIIQNNEYQFANKVINDIFLVDNEVNADIQVDFGSRYLTPLRLDSFRFKLLSSIRNELTSIFIG